MRFMLHELAEWSPASEEGIILEALNAQTPVVTPSNSANAAPVLIGGAVAVATLGLFAIMSLIIRASLRQRRPTTFPIGPVTQQERENDSEAGTEGPATSALNRPSKQIPTRVPVVIVEPDATVEVAYALRHDPETGEVPLTARFPTRAPLLRAPTVPRLSLDESGPGVVDSERTPSKTGSKENLPQVG